MRIAPAEPHPIVKEFLAAREAADQANVRLGEAQEKLLIYMAEGQTKTIKWTDAENRIASITYVQNRTPVIDEKGLRKALTAKVFDRYTVRKLDRKAMEAAMDAGEIDPVTVAKFVTEKLSAPYAKFTLTAPKEEQ